MRQLHEVPGVGKAKKKTNPAMVFLGGSCLLAIVSIGAAAMGFGFTVGMDLAGRILDYIGG